MKKTILLFAVLTFLFSAAVEATPRKQSRKETKALVQMVDRSLELSRKQAIFLAETMLPMENKLPRTYQDDMLRVTDYTAWTSGFFPGVLWQLYEVYRDEQLLHYARHFTDIVEPAKNVRSHHDVGFMIYNSAGQAYRLTGEPHYLDVVKTASESLSIPSGLEQ